MEIDDGTILAYIQNELSQAAGGNENDFVDSNRQAALAAYLGQPDGRETEGRSSVTSTDVADAIEWIMPEIVKAFTQNNDVVTFDAAFDGDEAQAELESAYVYDILMKENNGFLIIHQFVKDILIQKNGFVKVFYSKDNSVTTETYTGLSETEYNMVLSNPSVELLEETMEELPPTPEMPEGLVSFNVKVSVTQESGMVNVVSVPPEEFRVNRQHPSINLDDARFSAHVVLKTAGSLVEEGYEKEFVDSIPSSNVYEDDREYRFYMQDEIVYPDRNNSLDPSLRNIEVAECYMQMDYEDNGIHKLVKVDVAGGDNPDILLNIEEIDENPFVSSTAILMSHKLFGLSIYDRLKEIQEQKTTLWRNIFDNMYLQNNQRSIVVENQVNLDDLMISRPGGIIRVKRPDAIQPYQTPALPSDSYQMMDYLDTVRAARSGVIPEGPIQDSMIGDRVGSEGVQSMMSQREELVGLMIRVIAETGIKPICIKIRNQVMKHQDVAKDYKFRGQWVSVNPSDWKKRTHTTVRVGTGSGNRREQSAAIANIMAMQEKILSNPSQALVRENEVFNAANDFAKFSGMVSIRQYLLDPKSPEGQQHKQQVDESNQKQQEMQQKMEAVNAEATQKIAAAEESKAKTAMMNVQLKSQLDAQELQSDNQISMLKQQVEEAKLLLDKHGKTEELDFKYYDVDQKARIERERIESQKFIATHNDKDGGE